MRWHWRQLGKRLELITCTTTAMFAALAKLVLFDVFDDWWWQGRQRRRRGARGCRRMCRLLACVLVRHCDQLGRSCDHFDAAMTDCQSTDYQAASQGER